MEDLLILQILAHLISDFYGQSENICKQKKEKAFYSASLYLHALFTFIAAWLFSFSLNFVLYALIIAVSHLFIDGIKSLLKKWKYVFFADQLVHIAIIYVVVAFYSQRVGGSLPEYLPQTYHLLLIVGLIICLKPTNILVKEVLNTFEIKQSDSAEKSEELEKAGRIIGNLERMLTLIFVLLGQYGAIGFLITAKSILRFKDTATAKTEYVLIGTLLSFGVAIIVGVIILALKY